VDDEVGNAGVTVLSNGNFVVRSTFWDGTAADVGAVTWCNGSTGINGVVSATNSLVGSTASDRIGNIGVTALVNGNYVVSSSTWDGVAVNVGAATWGNGTTGTTGMVSAANSLVGSTANDNVALGGATALANGNYVVRSTFWDGAAVDVGAVTWCNGVTGTTGTVSAANSLVGSTLNDDIGNGGVFALPNGNYVVRNISWDNPSVAVDAGSVTFGNGTTGIVGAVSATNSLVSDRASSLTGSGGITVLSNSNYVVGSPLWEAGVPGFNDIGAATWCSGTTGRVGLISAANSLIGSTASDGVGGGVVALRNGNYVVNSPNWDNGAAVDAGAAMWCNGSTGTTGTISSANALVGLLSSNNVGSSVLALPGGNYVVNSPGWDDVGSTGTGKGAVTFCGGPTGLTGAVSTANSLTGRGSDVAIQQQRVGSGGIVALTNGNYVVSSTNWEDAIPVNPQDPSDAGAVTWCSASGGLGTVTTANSLFGTSQNDNVGQVTALANGNYVVSSPLWDNGTATNGGAVTWCNGTNGLIGQVTAGNSLFGSTTNDGVGVVTALSDGNYVVRSPNWDNGALTDAGAVTLGLAGGGTVGTITTNNSVLGTVAGGGANLVFDYDPARQQLVVGRRNSNLVTLFRYVNSIAPFNLSPTLVSNSFFRISFTSTAGVTFTALAATNLALPVSNWSVLGTATEISPGQFQFTDPQPATNARSFYRVRSP
jgi:hypothetical protein